MAGTEPHAWGTGLMEDTTFVGLDVHKATVCVAVAESGRGGEVRQIGVFENRPEILCKMAARLGAGGRRLSFCYEPGGMSSSPSSHLFVEPDVLHAPIVDDTVDHHRPALYRRLPAIGEAVVEDDRQRSKT